MREATGSAYYKKTISHSEIENVCHGAHPNTPKDNATKKGHDFNLLNSFVRHYKMKLCLAKKPTFWNRNEELKLDFREYVTMKTNMTHGTHNPYLIIDEVKRQQRDRKDEQIVARIDNHPPKSHVFIPPHVPDEDFGDFPRGISQKELQAREQEIARRKYKQKMQILNQELGEFAVPEFNVHELQLATEREIDFRALEKKTL